MVCYIIPRYVINFRGHHQERYPSDNFTPNFFVSAHSNTALIIPNDSTIYL